MLVIQNSYFNIGYSKQLFQYRLFEAIIPILVIRSTYLNIAYSKLLFQY